MWISTVFVNDIWEHLLTISYPKLIVYSPPDCSWLMFWCDQVNLMNSIVPHFIRDGQVGRLTDLVWYIKLCAAQVFDHFDAHLFLDLCSFFVSDLWWEWTFILCSGDYFSFIECQSLVGGFEFSIYQSIVLCVSYLVLAFYFFFLIQ